MRKKEDYLDKIKGAILGFAIGDAMGAPLEFSNAGRTVEGFEPSPKKGLRPGQYTDDTQHLEIGLDSILASNGDINLQDQASRLVQWYKSGEARSIGRTTELAVKNLMEGKNYKQSGINHINACGSLGLSRLLPYSLVSAVSRYPNKIEDSDIKKIMAITHAHKRVYDMGRLFNYFVQDVANGRKPKETLDMIIFENNFLNQRIRKKLGNVRDLSKEDKNYKEVIKKIGSSGFIEDVIFSAIYSTIEGSSFEEAVLISANGEGDSDSRAALTGALYGLDVGASRIPDNLKDNLERNKDLERKAGEIYYLKK